MLTSASGILGLEVHELRDDEVRHRAVDLRAEQHDPLSEQAGEQVRVALAARVALDHVGDG